MSLKVSRGQLDRLTKRGAVVEEKPKVAPIKPPEPPPPPPEPKPDPNIEILAQAAQSSAQAAQAVQMTAADLKAAITELKTPSPVPETPTGAVRMVVVRDRKGLIDYIDVIREPMQQRG